MLFTILKSTLFDINIITPDFLCWLFAWGIFFPLFYFKLFGFLYLKCIWCRNHIVGSWFLSIKLWQFLLCYFTYIWCNYWGFNLNTASCYLLSISLLFSECLLLLSRLCWNYWIYFNSPYLFMGSLLLIIAVGQWFSSRMISQPHLSPQPGYLVLSGDSFCCDPNVIFY